MAPAYVPGKCNIGARGRAIRLAIGASIVATFLPLDLLALGSVLSWFRLLLVVPLYVGFLATLEGTKSFCVLHASRGTYDFHEPARMALGSSVTKTAVGQAEWRRIDRRKARIMHVGAGLAALVLVLLLALA